MIAPNDELRDPTPEELEQIRILDADAGIDSGEDEVIIPDSEFRVPLNDDGAYFQIDPKLVEKEAEQEMQNLAHIGASPQEPTMNEMLGLDQETEEAAFETFKYFKKQGAFSSNASALEMLYDGVEMIGDSMGEMAKTFPERFAANFAFTEAGKKRKAESVATTLQMYGDIKLNWEGLVNGADRLIESFGADETSDEDLRSSYEFWKRFNEIENERLIIAADLAKDSWLVYGGDPEIRKMIADGVVQPNREASMGASMIADPSNFIPFSAAFKTSGQIANRVFRGSQIALVKDTKKMLVQQAIMRHALKKGALEGSQEGMHQTIKGLDGSILRNLDKIKSMSVHQRQALLDFAGKLPRGTKFRTRIEKVIKGVPVKGVSSLFGKAAGVGMIAAGKTVENAGNILKFMQDLVPETAITMAVKLGIPEEKAVQLFDRGLVRQISGYGVAGVGSYAITDFLTDDEMLAMVATGTALGLPLFARAGRNTAILGREIMEPMTELPLFKRLQANGKETITDRIIDRSGYGATWKSLAEKSYRAGEGKIKNRAIGVRGSLSSSAQTTVNFLEKTKLARGVESAGRLANQTGKGAAIGASFGYVAGGGGEQEEAMYAGMGGGAAFGAGGYTMSKPFRMMKGASPLEINQRRYGSHQYFVKNLLPEGMKESFGNMSKEVQIAYANAAMSYKNTVFNFKALGRNEKGGRQYTHDGVSYIEVNTDSGWAIEPLLRHEISHYLEETGGTRAFNDLLLGNPLLGKKGMFTRVDSEGNPVLKKDGKSYESTKELDNWKYEYGKYFFEEGKPRDEVIAAIPDEVIAREIVAEHGADFFASDSRRYRDLHEGVTGAIMRALVSSPMLKNRTLLRSMLARLGGTFREDGILMSPNAVFGKMQRLPAVTELIRKYNRQIEGLSDEQVQTKFPKEDGDNVIDITGAEFAKNPELIEHLRAGTFMKVDENGNIVPDTAMTPAQQRKYNKSLSEAIQSAIKKRDAAAGLAAGHIRERINEDTGAISFEGRFIDNEIINDVAQMGGWNKEQINLLRQLSFATKNYENEKGGSDWLVSYFKATGKGGGKYVNARVQHQVHVPYGFEISQKGNILIRTISVDALHKNIDKVFKKHGAEISRLFGTENAMDVFTDSMHQYHKNHAEGRSGWFGLDADNQLAREKANFINAMFGKSSKSHLESNPWLDALDSGPKSGKTNPIYRSLRLERIGKADQLSGKRHVDPHKIINNLMPKSRGKEVLSDGEQITGKNMGAYMYTPEEFTGNKPVKQPSEFQKQFDIQKFSKGGKFFDLKTGDEMTNKTYDGMTIDTVERNRPNAITSDTPATLPTGHSSKVGKDVKVNMVNGRQGQTKFKWWKGDPKDKKIDNSKDWDFDRQAGESWLVSIESTGLEGNGRKVPVGGKDTDHVFARKLINEVPTKLATYPKSKSNPRGRPTAKGEVVTGNVVGTMRMGKFNHFVYDEVRVVPFGQKNMPKRSPDHGLLGNVENGELLYSKTGDLHMMNHSEPISAAPRGNPWRYNAAEEAVYWWEGMPTKLDKDTVAAHLERKGYNVKRNKALDANSENFARDYESAHAFPLKQMPAKEKPFKPRLQKDSVLLRDGTIIEASGLRPTYDKYGRTQMTRAGDSHSQALFNWVRENPKNKLAKKIGWKTQEEFFDYEGTLFDKMNEGMKQGLLVRITNDPDGSIIVNGKDSAFTPEVKRILDEEGIFREKDILFEDADSNKITDYYKVPEMEKPKKGFFSMFGKNMPPKIEAEPKVTTRQVKALEKALQSNDVYTRISKGWQAVTNSHKAFKVPFTFSKDIDVITKQASDGKLSIVHHRKPKNSHSLRKATFYIVSAKDKNKQVGDLLEYIEGHVDRENVLHVDASAASQKQGFGYTAYQILLDYAASNNLIYQPSGLTYINSARVNSAMLSSALKHKSTKHLSLTSSLGLPQSVMATFGKNTKQDIATLAIKELEKAQMRFPELAEFSYDFKKAKFLTHDGKPTSDKAITEKLVSNKRDLTEDGEPHHPLNDGIGLTTAKRALVTKALLFSSVKDGGAFSENVLKSGSLDSIMYMPPKKTFDAVDPDVIRSLEGNKDQVQNKLTMADYGENPFIDSVALPSRMGVINQKVSGMFKSYDDVVQLIDKLADKIEYYMDQYPDFAARTASFYSDMGRTAFDMAKYVPMKGRDRFDIADLQLRFLALGSPRSAVAANMTKSARSIMGHMTGISGHKINPVDQQIAAQVTALDWKSGKHFEVLDPDRKGASDKVRNFYLNGLAELIQIAKTEGTQKDVDGLLKRAAITLDVIKPNQNLNAVTSVKLQKLLDGLATVDMWDMAAKEYAHPAYVIKKGRPTANAKPFLWSIPKHRVIGKMVLSGNSNWKTALKETGIDSAAELNFQQANSFQIDGKNNWNETTWNKRSKEGFNENTEWSYYTLADEGGLTPQGGGPLYDAHQTVDGLIADTLNRRGHAEFFGKDKLLARNAQEILWALTKFENPLESNQKLVLFGDRFKHFQEAMVGIRSEGIGVSNHRVLGRKGASKEAQGIIGAILDTYNKTSDQKFPFEVDTFGTSKNAKSVQGKINELGKGNRDDGVMELTSVVADGLGDSVQRIADQYGQELVVQDVTQGFGGYTENGVPAVTPNISMTMRGDPAVVKQVMMEVSSALDQADGNVFRQPTILELNDPRMQFNEAVSFDVSTLDKTAQANFFNDLSQLVDGDGDAFLTGFTGTSDGMFIADQYYKSNRLHSEVKNNHVAIKKIMQKHKVSDLNTHKLVAETFSRDDKVGKRSSFQRSINNLVRNKVRNAQGRKSKDLPRVGSPLQRVIDQMHSANNRELTGKEITDISARLASDLDLLLIEGKISEDSNAGHKEMIKEVLGKKRGKKFDTPRKLEKRQLEKLDSPKTTLKDKKATLWNMRPNQESGSGYFNPRSFENKAKKISGGKGIDLLGKETRKTFKSKNTYFTSPTQSGRVKK